MTIYAQLADGRKLPFPDGTPQDVVNMNVKRFLAQHPAGLDVKALAGAEEYQDLANRSQRLLNPNPYQKQAQAASPWQAFGVSTAEGARTVGRGLGILDKETDPGQIQAYNALKEEYPTATMLGEVTGESAPFAIVPAGGAGTWLTRVMGTAALGAAETGIISKGKGNDTFESIKNAGMGGVVAGSVQAMLPMVGRAFGSLFHKITGRVPKSTLLTSEGIPTQELNNALEKSGLSFDDFSDEAVKLLRKEGQTATPDDAVRKAFLESQGLVDNAAPTTAQVTRNPNAFGVQQELAKPTGSAPVRQRLENQQGVLTDRFGRAVDQTGGTATQDTNTVVNHVMDKSLELDKQISDLYQIARERTIDQPAIKLDSFTDALKRLESDDDLTGGLVSGIKGVATKRGLIGNARRSMDPIEQKALDEIISKIPDYPMTFDYTKSALINLKNTKNLSAAEIGEIEKLSAGINKVIASGQSTRNLPGIYKTLDESIAKSGVKIPESAIAKIKKGIDADVKRLASMNKAGAMKDFNGKLVDTDKLADEYATNLKRIAAEQKKGAEPDIEAMSAALMKKEIPAMQQYGETPKEFSKRITADYQRVFKSDPLVKGGGKPAAPEPIFTHETDANFKDFDSAMSGSGQGESWLGNGIYFNEKGNFKIENYGKNKIDRMLSKDANIFKVKDTPDGKYRDTFVEFAVENDIGNAKWLADEAIKDGSDLKNLLPRDILKRNPGATDQLKKLGYDGLLQDGELVVYNPKILKEVTAPATNPQIANLEARNATIQDILSKTTPGQNVSELMNKYNQAAFKEPGKITVEEAEKLVQSINKRFNPGNPNSNRVSRILKDAIDDDVLAAGGEDLFRKARKTKAVFHKNLDRQKLNKFDKRKVSLPRDILENKIDPDDFLNKVVLGKTYRAEDIKHLKDYLTTGTPEEVAAGTKAFDDLRAETMDYIKSASFIGPEDAAGNQNLSRHALERTLKRIGGKRINELFNVEERKFLQSMLKVSRLLEPSRGAQQGLGPSAQSVQKLYQSMKRRVAKQPVLGAFIDMEWDKSGKVLRGMPTMRIEDNGLKAIGRTAIPLGIASGMISGESTE